MPLSKETNREIIECKTRIGGLGVVSKSVKSIWKHFLQGTPQINNRQKLILKFSTFKIDSYLETWNRIFW